MITPEIIIVISILAIAIILFVTEIIRLDVTALLVAVTLGLTGVLTPSEAFSGFSSEAVLAVLGILIIGIALEKTGAVEIISKIFGGDKKKSYNFLITTIIFAAVVLSSVMNNVVAVAILLPSVIRVATISKIPPSKLLIPLAFGTSFGGMLTLIGTPPNIIVSSQLTQGGLSSFNMFDFFPVGIVVTIAGLIYFLTWGKKLLPNHSVRTSSGTAPTGNELIELYKIDRALYETLIPDKSILVGKSLLDTGLGQHYRVNVIAVLNRGGVRVYPSPDYLIKAGDKLILTGNVETLHTVESNFDLSIESSREFSLKDLEQLNITHIEAIISPRSDLEGKTLRGVKFRDRYNVNVIAIWRGGDTISSGIGDTALKTGDALLIQGSHEKLSLLNDSEDLIVVGEPPEKKQNRKSPLAIGIFLLSIIPAVLGFIPISIAALSGALLLILTRCISIEQAYKNLQWKIVFLMAGVIPLGLALQKTGAAKFISDYILKPFPGNEPVVLLSIVFLLTLLLCVTTSNNTAALIMAPIGFAKATSVGVDPALVMLVVAYAASTSFLTPVAHQSNVLVMGAGGYTKSDYFKVGLPLTIITGLIVIGMLVWKG